MSRRRNASFHLLVVGLQNSWIYKLFGECAQLTKWRRLLLGIIGVTLFLLIPLGVSSVDQALPLEMLSQNKGVLTQFLPSNRPSNSSIYVMTSDGKETRYWGAMVHNKSRVKDMIGKTVTVYFHRKIRLDMPFRSLLGGVLTVDRLESSTGQILIKYPYTEIKERENQFNRIIQVLIIISATALLILLAICRKYRSLRRS